MSHLALAELTSSHRPWEQCGLQPHPANRSVDRSFSPKNVAVHDGVGGCLRRFYMALGSHALAISDKSGRRNEKGRVPGEYVDC